MIGIGCVEQTSCSVRTAGRVSDRTLEKWALIRQIAELEEALADTFHCADLDSGYAWAEAVRHDLAVKRAALRSL